MYVLWYFIYLLQLNIELVNQAQISYKTLHDDVERRNTSKFY